VVVLDPGHGGTNSGAFGRYVGTYEKTLTLDLARRVERFLRQWRPDLRIVLTRTRDRYLTLNQRVRRANKAGAALFVSIHFNASVTRSQRGHVTFFLTQEASRKEAGQMAQRTRRRGGVVGAILSDLRQSVAHGESARLAQRVQRHLTGVRGEAHDHGVRQAPFDVLLGLEMPGVLVEAGFIDHPKESLELVRPATLEAIAAALAAAVSEHLPVKPLAAPRS
jgi:N-acetylmuramoyl-L-alanine amidase